MLPSIGRVSYTDASGLKPRINTRNDRIPQPSSRSKKNKVEDQLRKFKSSSNKNNYVSYCNANVKNVALSKNSENVCLSCNECFFSANHELLNILTIWKPTGRMFNMDRSICPIAKTTSATIMPSGNRLHTISIPAVAPNAETQMRYFIAKNYLIRAHINRYGFPSPNFAFIVKIVLWYLDSSIMGYGDLQIGNILISRVYYVKGLGHNLFSVGQFCDSDLEVAFKKHTCFVRNLEGVDLLSGSRGSNLYTISMEEMMKSSLICLLSKSSKTKSWLWHRRMSHLNFGTINQLAKEGLVKDAPSPSTSPTNETTTTPIQSTNVEELNNEDEDAEFDNDTFTNLFAPPDTSSAESSLRIVDTSGMHTFQQPHSHIQR
ncbi:integrase, catalytic region, zinc finger, CCHC-type containing protein [Tanacetum coccineum]